MKSLKPGQVCQIRGMPPTTPGYTLAGSIVTITEIKHVDPLHGVVWRFEPELHATVEGRPVVFRGCAAKWLHPLPDFDWDQEILDMTLQQTFQEQLAKNLGL